MAALDSFDLLTPTGPEQVTFCHDPATGLRAIIAVDNTALGPALGGTRMRPYPTVDDALVDVLALARAMTYKNALAGIAHGGGKAVIIGDPATDKSPELFHAYGTFVAGLAGRYITAADVGTVPADLDLVAERCPYVTGRSADHGGAGDSGILTAFGVWQSMRAVVAHRFGEDATLRGRTVGVQGVGKVGRRLVDHLLRDGATVVVTDPNALALADVAERHPDVQVAATLDDLVAHELDVFSPNALGGVLDAVLAERLAASIVCGGANNQLTDDSVASVLHDRGVLYAPDFVVNSGGVIAVADEWLGYDDARARAAVLHLYDTTRELLALAEREGVTPLAAAEQLARARLAQGRRVAWAPTA